jgi:hypothetical protein
MTALPGTLGGYKEHLAVDEAILCGLLRCVFSNPFRPIPFDPAPRTATVVSLARAADEERVMPGGEAADRHAAGLAPRELGHDRLLAVGAALHKLAK